MSGFNAGGDDYLTKPFALAELLVRVGRCCAGGCPSPRPPQPPAFVLDPGRHALRHGDREAVADPDGVPRSSPRSRPHPATSCATPALIAAAWPDGAIVHDNTLHVYLGRIRRKLREVGSAAAIDTVRSVGYRLR